MDTRRRIAIGAASALVALTIAAGALWVWWIPGAVEARVAEAAARRGLRVSVGGVHVAFSDVVLHDVRLEGDGLRVDVARVRLGASLWDIATEGSAALREIAVREVRAQVDLDHAGLSETLARLRGAPREDAERAHRGRAVRVDGLALVLSDRQGVLATLEDARASLEHEELRVVTGALEIAPGEADGARAEGVQLRLARADEGWTIAYGAVVRPEIRYRERDGGARSPLLARLRAHAARFAPDRAGADDAAQRGGGDGDDGRAAPAPSDAQSAQEAPQASATASREARAASEDLAAVPGTESDAASDAHGGSTAVELLAHARALLGPRLRQGAVLEVQDLAVRAHTGGEDRLVLRDLEAEVRALPESRFELSGSGRPGRGGRLGWRLVVDPDELRAEGRIDFQRLPFVLVVPFLPPLPWHAPEDARVSGELSIEGRGATRVHLEGEVTVDDLALSSPRIAPEPVRRIGFQLSGEADWLPLPRRLELSRATLTLGAASAHLAGSLEWAEDHYLVDLRATLPPTDCNTAVGAIPADLLAELAVFTFSGQIGAQVEVRIDSRDLDATRLEVDVADGCRFETAPALADVRRFEAPFTHRVLEPDGSVFEMETGPGTPSWTPIREISPFLVHAVLGHEDGGFFGHEGFSVPSVRSALIRNLRARRYVYGASTITMQLVKNVFLHREKTLARKVQEVLLTWWVESVMTKEKILELYLNVIEYGPGVYGIRNAAEHYFGRAPSELGPAESAYLACILPNPKAYHSHWQEGAVPERFRRRVVRFLQTLGARGRYDAEAVAAGLEGIETLAFHRPGSPRPAREVRGATAPLPFGPALDRAWEEAVGPDDPGAEDGEQPEDEWFGP